MSHAVALSDAKTPSRGRAVGAFGIFLVAALLVPVGVIGSWASRTVADTDRYVETVTALIDSPEVRAEVSTQLTNILFDALPTGELAKSVLPNNGDALSGIVTQAAKAALQNAVASALASPQARKAWATLNRQIQSNLIAALQGDSNSVFQIKGDAIVLDTGVLIERVRTLLVEQGLTVFANISVPQAADRELVLVRDQQVKVISTTYRIVQPLANGLIWLALFLLALGIWVINRRRVGILISGWIFLLTGAFILATFGVAKSLALSGLSVAENSWQAVTAETVLRYLPGLGRTCVAIGIVAIAAGVLAGSSALGQWIRKVFVSGSGVLGREIGKLGPVAQQAGNVEGKKKIIALVIGVLAFAGLYTSDTVSAGRVAWVTSLGVIAWFITFALAAAGGTTETSDGPAVEAPAEGDALLG
ncbi:MAG: hypothetical protein NTU50_02720 [Actinobacteria bacterium]|nr:hypothetical protein [Actinomycetota bacterium]